MILEVGRLPLVICIGDLTEDEEPFAAVVTEVRVHLQADIRGILLEALDRHTQLIGVLLTLGVVAGRSRVLDVVRTDLILRILEPVTGLRGDRPPEHITIVMPVCTTCRAWEGEDDFVGGLVVPVEGSIPAVSYLVGAVLAVEDILSVLRTLGVVVLTDVDLCIEVEAHQEGCGTGLRPLTLRGLIATERRLASQLGQGSLQLRFDEVIDLARLYLTRGVLARVIVAHRQRDVAEGVQQTEVEPRTQHSILRLEVLELRIGEPELRS